MNVNQVSHITDSGKEINICAMVKYILKYIDISSYSFCYLFVHTNYAFIPSIYRK